ncbi:MAG: Rieske 2Fe-2S domain-containing protein [Myxococcales bacterium]|nr:Rieske 2Fe-2S domain-containing protein [Myxococcales bacterium]
MDWPQDTYISRRELGKFLVLTSFAFVVGQAWIWIKGWFGRAPKWPVTKIGRVSEISVGETLLFHYPDKLHPRLLVRASEHELLAYDQKCTHLSCPVIAEVDKSIFYCPCHHGTFDLKTGRVISGPPPRPLPKVKLRVQGDEIFAVGVEDRMS